MAAALQTCTLKNLECLSYWRLWRTFYGWERGRSRGVHFAYHLQGGNKCSSSVQKTYFSLSHLNVTFWCTVGTGLCYHSSFTAFVTPVSQSDRRNAPSQALSTSTQAVLAQLAMFDTKWEWDMSSQTWICSIRGTSDLNLLFQTTPSASDFNQYWCEFLLKTSKFLFCSLSKLYKNL